MSHLLAAQRVQRLSQCCRDNGWSYLLLFGNSWRCDTTRYAANFATLEGMAFILVQPGQQPVLFVETAEEAERAGVEATGCEVSFSPDITAEVNARLDGMEGPGAAAPFGLIPLGIELPNGCEAGDRPFVDLLVDKLEPEIEATRKAAELADRGYDVFRDACRPGVTEYEIIAEVEAFLRQEGCPDNFMIIGSGGPEVRGMHPPGSRRLQVGDMVTTELTPCVNGYYAQLCRTLVVGEASEAQRAAFGVFRDAFEAGLAAVRPGVTAAEVARKENDVFRAHGLGEYTTSTYTRVRGHGLGSYLDTPPALLEDVDMPLSENMTIIVHPNTYHPEVGYIVFGDSMVVRSDGPEVISSTPRDLFSVPA